MATGAEKRAVRPENQAPSRKYAAYCPNGNTDAPCMPTKAPRTGRCTREYGNQVSASPAAAASATAQPCATTRRSAPCSAQTSTYSRAKLSRNSE